MEAASISKQQPPEAASTSKPQPPEAASTSKPQAASSLKQPPPLEAPIDAVAIDADAVAIDADAVAIDADAVAIDAVGIDVEVPMDAAPIDAVPVNCYQQNRLVWKTNQQYCKNRLFSGDNFKLRRMLVEPSWEAALESEFEKDYVLNLCKYVEDQVEAYTVCPRKHHIFRCFNTIPLPSVKVVILGQKEPYPHKGRAMGMAYSVPNGRNHPLELENILLEVGNDIGGGSVLKGNLENWTFQGVMLLSFALTVQRNKPNSHTGHGWERLIDTVIERISVEKNNVVFMLWGKMAHMKISLIDVTKHLVLKAASPSQKSFLGCKHFSQANDYLQHNGMHPIEWKM